MILIYVLLLVPLVRAEMNSSKLLMYLQNLSSRQPGLFLPGVTRKFTLTLDSEERSISSIVYHSLFRFVDDQNSAYIIKRKKLSYCQQLNFSNHI